MRQATVRDVASERPGLGDKGRIIKTSALALKEVIDVLFLSSFYGEKSKCVNSSRLHFIRRQIEGLAH